MELAWLEDFVALSDERSFSLAAEARHVTQPTFSRRIRALEDWVGTPLFVRSPQGVTLTPAGEQFGRGAAKLISGLTQLRRDAHDATTTTLNFAATHALVFTFFPGWMREIERRGAIGPVRLFSDSLAACEELLLQGQAQFLLCHRHALAPGKFDPSQFRSTVVGMDALVPLVAPAADGRPRWHVEQSTPLPLLSYSADSGLGRIFAAHRFGDRLPGLESVGSAPLAATLLGMAREGRGIAWLPAGLAAKDIAQGALVRAGDAQWEVPIEIGLFCPAAQQSSTAERFWAGLQPVHA